MDFLSNSDTVRATIGMERSAGGGLFVGSSAYAAVFGTASSGNTEFATNNNIQMKIDSTGAVTMPNQPAFLVHPSSNQNNFASDGSSVAVAFGTERFDQNDDFASNTFTAPVTGKYQLNVVLRLENLDSASGFYQVSLLTSNKTYDNTFDPDFGQDAAYWTPIVSIIADMDANDTASVTVRQNGGTAQTDIHTNSFFSGFLVC